MFLEHVTDTKCDITPFEFCRWEEIEFGSDVQRELERDRLRYEFNTCLSNDSNAKLSIIATSPHAQVSTDTGKPVELASEVSNILINTRQRNNAGTSP